MELVLSDSPIYNSGMLFSSEIDQNDSSPIMAVFDANELAFELGLWLMGLESFLRTSDHIFVDRSRNGNTVRDWTKECRIMHSALLICSKLNFRLRRLLAQDDEPSGFTAAGADALTARDLDDFALVLRDAIVLNESIIKSEPLGFGEWRSWNVVLAGKLTASSVFGKITAITEGVGEQALPDGFRALLDKKSIPFADEADLHQILPRFANILKSLNVVGNMLRTDQPLKPTLLIFSRIYEQTNELIGSINNRLSRLPDESAEMFASLDGASYTASLELKKVFNQELTGLVGVRPSPSVYARVETAYSLLSDSFQQILAGFAHIIDPDVSPYDLFPNFQGKLHKSLILRESMWKVLKAVQGAEQNPDKQTVEGMKTELTDFLEDAVRYLFYKDKETLERFGEEILATTDKKDLVPILHRFGAYLETLFGQINMRSVLANHPFQELDN